jgi:hypothetical protein
VIEKLWCYTERVYYFFNTKIISVIRKQHHQNQLNKTFT